MTDKCHLLFLTVTCLGMLFLMLKKHLLFIVIDECLFFLTATNKNLLFCCDSMTYREETIVFNATNKCLLFTDKTGFKENNYNSLYMLFTRYIINIFTKQTIY